MRDLPGSSTFHEGEVGDVELAPESSGPADGNVGCRSLRCTRGVGAGTAAAGTNGQHISYYSRSAYAQCTTGKNQNSENVENCTQLSRGHNLDEGYRWVGTVRIIWQKPDGSRMASTCDVPKLQEGDSYACYEPL